MLTWQDSYTKFQKISSDNNADVLIQAKQDMNIAYHRINSAMTRYYLRKQQFTNIVANQQYYQTPVDCIRVMGITVKLNSGNIEIPVQQIRSEFKWRTINSVRRTSNWEAYYFLIGNDLVGLWPTPSANITSGMRFFYEVQDVDLTQDDYTTGTIAITNGSQTVTGTGTSWTSNMAGRQLATTDGSDGNFYEISTVNSATSITLKNPYAGLSGTLATYRIGQMFIFPPEYHDAPVDYALARYYEFKNNPQRATYHMQKYKQSLDDALEKYSSSSESAVITDQDVPGLNVWLVPPDPTSVT